jgi:hypothetical protein
VGEAAGDAGADAGALAEAEADADGDVEAAGDGVDFAAVLDEPQALTRRMATT